MAELVAVTVNDKVLGAVLGGTVGAVILSRKAKFQVLCERRDFEPSRFYPPDPKFAVNAKSTT